MADAPSTGDGLRALITSETDARTRGLLVEAGRIADRLDELDRIIAGDGVLQLMRFRLKTLDADEDSRLVSVEVKFDGVLAEARQQAGALKALLAQLGVPKVEAVVKARSSVDELRARRAARTAEGLAEAEGAASS